METSLLSPLSFLPRFLHITKMIFAQLDNERLKNCKKVSKSWLKSIDDRYHTWICIINIPKIVLDTDTYLHLASKRGQRKMFEMIFEQEDVKNPENGSGKTPFHLACQEGHLQIAHIMVQKSFEFNIDLNAKEEDGWIAFHAACGNGNLTIVNMLVQKSVEFHIDLNSKDRYGWTAFHTACGN